MAAEAVLLFKEEMKEALKDRLTCGQLEAVIGAVDETLANYEIQRNDYEKGGKDFLLQAFMDAMRVEGRSGKTLERYEYILGRFLQAAGVNSRNVNTYHIRRFLADEKARGIADSTLNGYRWVLGAYFGWLNRDGLIPRDPMGNVGPVRCAKKIKEVFSEVDVEKLKRAAENPRDLAVICFLMATGCRVSEMTGLNRGDVDLQELSCLVTGKGNKQRTVYMDPVTGMTLQTYLDGRKDGNEALFVGRTGERLEPNGVRCMLNRVSEKAGVVHVHPHKFRRTEITNLVNRGMPIEQVRTLAGHEKIDTTMGYVVMNQANVENAYRKFA